MKRYSASLLFQFRADLGDGKSDIMRLCEKRIIVLPARNAASALKKAKVYARKQEFVGKAEAGNPILFEFVGLQDLLELGPECDEVEVWYDIVTLKQPSERKAVLIPADDDLHAIAEEREIREDREQA